MGQPVRHHRPHPGQISPDRRVAGVQGRRPRQKFKRRLGVSPSDLGDCRLVQPVRIRMRCLRGDDKPSREEHPDENLPGPDPSALHNEWTAHAVRWPEVLAVAAGERLERETGFEPATPSLEGSRSSQLSYSRLPVTLHTLALKTAGATLQFGVPLPRNPAARPTAPGSTHGGERRIRTSEGMSQQIYSLPPLAAWVSPQIPRRAARRARSSSEARSGGAGGGNRTPDPLITNQLLYLLSYASRQSPSIFKGLPLGKSFLRTSRKGRRIHPLPVKGMHSIPTTESLSTPTRV